MRRLRPFPLEDLLLAQAVPGFLLAVGWTVMYEIYHEDGSYYTTLMQEILGGDGLYTDFLISAVLMAPAIVNSIVPPPSTCAMYASVASFRTAALK